MNVELVGKTFEQIKEDRTKEMKRIFKGTDKLKNVDIKDEPEQIFSEMIVKVHVPKVEIPEHDETFNVGWNCWDDTWNVDIPEIFEATKELL